MKAADVMATNVITVRLDTPVATIAEVLLANRISAVPVVNDKDVLVGIVSEGDLIHRVEAGTERHRSWWLELLTGKEVLAHEFVMSHARKAADVMTSPVISVPPETSLGDIASLLEKHRIKRVPVANNGKIVGIVSRANLIQALVNLNKRRHRTRRLTIRPCTATSSRNCDQSRGSIRPRSTSSSMTAPSNCGASSTPRARRTRSALRSR